jgi:hypothetical protein
MLSDVNLELPNTRGDSLALMTRPMWKGSDGSTECSTFRLCSTYLHLVRHNITPQRRAANVRHELSNRTASHGMVRKRELRLQYSIVVVVLLLFSWEGAGGVVELAGLRAKAVR